MLWFRFRAWLTGVLWSCGLLSQSCADYVRKWVYWRWTWQALGHPDVCVNCSYEHPNVCKDCPFGKLHMGLMEEAGAFDGHT